MARKPLRLVQQAAPGGPIVVRLADRTARRLAALAHARDAAVTVAQTAVNAANAVTAKYEEAVTAALEHENIDARAFKRHHDLDDDRIVLVPVEQPEPAG